MAQHGTLSNPTQPSPAARSAPIMPLVLYWEEYPTFIASYTTWMYMPRSALQ